MSENQSALLWIVNIGIMLTRLPILAPEDKKHQTIWTNAKQPGVKPL